MTHLCPEFTLLRRSLGSQRAVLLDDGTPYTLKIFGTEAQIHFPHGNALHFHTDLPFPLYPCVFVTIQQRFVFLFVPLVYDKNTTKKNK